VLNELTGGAVALSDVVRVLTASLPMPKAPVTASKLEEDTLEVLLDGAQGVQVAARVDARDALLEELSVVRGEEALVHLDYGAAKKVGRDWMPGELSLDVPALGLRVDVDFESWDELGQVPEVFDLEPPPGSTEKDLVEALKEAALKEPGARPPP
jgi:hypothetical protein